MNVKKTVVFDFDGVIHSYTSGWKGEGVIPDPPVPGIKEAINEIRTAGYEVVVVSTRCASVQGHGAVRAWLLDNGIQVDAVKMEKPPAIAYIDDRAICFDGNSEELLNKISSFEPWYEKQLTNADRIRATGNELASMLHAVKLGYAPWCDYHCENQGDDGCDNCIKEWLKQPAKGE